MCYCGNMGMQWLLREESAQKLALEKKILLLLPGLKSVTF